MKVKTILAFLLVMWFGLTAQAAIEESHKETYDSGCVVNMSTASCFGTDPSGTAFSGPRATACVAYFYLDQRCRECADAYFNDGQPRGYKVCAYVSRAASCGCDYAGTARCEGYGACTYRS